MSAEQLRSLQIRRRHTCGGQPAERAWALMAAVAALTIPIAIVMCL
jgi:hypothetical protein